MKTLTNQTNGSNKTYKIWIANAGKKFAVRFAFGRIGSMLTVGTKATLATSGEAIALADKLTASKLAKGYRVASSPVKAVRKPAAATHRTRATKATGSGRAAALKAWVTIRANRAAAARG
jgi:predicted DNA-binding WGR domain protein